MAVRKVTFPSKFTTAKVRVNPRGEVQILIPPTKVKNGRTAKRVKNVEMGFWRNGVFHPIRRSDDYEPDEVGERYQWKPRKKKAKAKKRKNARPRVAKKNKARRR